MRTVPTCGVWAWTTPGLPPASHSWAVQFCLAGGPASLACTPSRSADWARSVSTSWPTWLLGAGVNRARAWVLAGASLLVTAAAFNRIMAIMTPAFMLNRFAAAAWSLAFVVVLTGLWLPIQLRRLQPPAASADLNPRVRFHTACATGGIFHVCRAKTETALAFADRQRRQLACGRRVCNAMARPMTS